MLFVVRDLQVERVNLLMNDLAAGLPSPLAFLGLAAAIAPELDTGRWDARVLPILHEVHASKGRTKPEMSLARGKPFRFAPTEIAEDLVGTVRASLLLDVPGCSSASRVADALAGRRLAGGPIVGETVEVRAVTPDGSAFAEVRRGYAIVHPRRGGLDLVASGRPHELEAFAEALFPTDGVSRKGWFVPVAVGHRLLESPEDAPRRRNTRDPNVPHVFTEPVVGIAELVSVRNARLTGLADDELSTLMWRWRSKDGWIVGHDFYHPNHRSAFDTE